MRRRSGSPARRVLTRSTPQPTRLAGRFRAGLAATRPPRTPFPQRNLPHRDAGAQAKCASWGQDFHRSLRAGQRTTTRWRSPRMRPSAISGDVIKTSRALSEDRPGALNPENLIDHPAPNAPGRSAALLLRGGARALIPRSEASARTTPKGGVRILKDACRRRPTCRCRCWRRWIRTGQGDHTGRPRSSIPSSRDLIW